MANRFEATARIPSRPLSYENKELAEEREILVDYTNHELYVHVGGEFFNITASVTAVIDQVIEKLTSDPTILQSIINTEENKETITNIVIELTNGDLVTINEGIVEAFARITNLETALGGVKTDADGNVIIVNEALDRIARLEEALGVIADGDGEIIVTIPATLIEETDGKKFVSQDQIDTWEAKADIFNIDVVVLGGTSNWTGSEAPFTQEITVATMKESYYPVVDVILSENYNTAMEQLNNYAYIYKITTFDGRIKVYATQVPEISLTLKMKCDK